jgi:hypothetical protein
MREISCGGEQGGFCFHASEIMSFGFAEENDK